MLSREALRAGAVRRMIQAREPSLALPSPAALAVDRRALLAGRDLSQGVWLFAYGSLIWNPLIEIAERRRGTLRGYHRRFCVWSALGRGSEETPGLLLALDHGGAWSFCASRPSGAKASWTSSGSGRCWPPSMSPAGSRCGARAARSRQSPLSPTVANRRQPPPPAAHAGRFPEERVLAALAAAEGPLGGRWLLTLGLRRGFRSERSRGGGRTRGRTGRRLNRAPAGRYKAALRPHLPAKTKSSRGRRVRGACSISRRRSGSAAGSPAWPMAMAVIGSKPSGRA